MAAASVIGSTHPLVCIVTKVLISDSTHRSLPKISVCFRHYSIETKLLKLLDLELWEPWVLQLSQLKQIKIIVMTVRQKKIGISVLQGWLLTMKKYTAEPLTTMAGHFYSCCDNAHDQNGNKKRSICACAQKTKKVQCYDSNILLLLFCISYSILLCKTL